MCGKKTRLIDANALKYDLGEIDDGLCKRTELYVTNEAIAKQPTIDAVPLPVVHKAAKKLAYIHQQIDLYGDRPDLHEEEYWLEYLMDEEWKDDEID